MPKKQDCAISSPFNFCSAEKHFRNIDVYWLLIKHFYHCIERIQSQTIGGIYCKRWIPSIKFVVLKYSNIVLLLENFSFL